MENKNNKTDEARAQSGRTDGYKKNKRIKIIKHSHRGTAWYDNLFNQVIDVIYVGQVNGLDWAEWYILAEDYHRFMQKPWCFQKGLRFIKQNFIEECA